MDFDIPANKWLKLLNDIIRRCFRKIRLSKSVKNEVLENLFKHKEEVVTEINQADDLDKTEKIKTDLKETMDKIAEICATRNKKLVNDYPRKTEDTLEGFSQIKTYSLKNRLCPKNSLDPP